MNKFRPIFFFIVKLETSNFPANIYLFKVNKINTRKGVKYVKKTLIIRKPDILNFEHTLHLFLLFLLLALNKYMLAELILITTKNLILVSE